MRIGGWIFAEAWTRMGSDNLLSVGMTRRVVNADWSGYAQI